MKRRDLVKVLGLIPLSGLFPRHEIFKGYAQSINSERLTRQEIFISDYNRNAFNVVSHFFRTAESLPLLYLHSSCGNGKTHLLEYFCAKSQIKDDSIVFLTGDNYLNQCVNAMRTQAMRDFRDKLYNADVLIVEDMNYVARGEAVQDELFCAIRRRIKQNKKVILTGDLHYSEIKWLDYRLTSLLQGGLYVEIHDPKLIELRSYAKFQSEKLKMEIDVTDMELVAHRNISLRGVHGDLRRFKMIEEICDISPVEKEQLYLSLRQNRFRTKLV